MFDRQRVADKVQAGITRLIGMQTADGGLAMWPGGREPWPWASVYAAHFLLEARAAGHAVPEEFTSHLLAYLRGLLNRSGDDAELLETQAYAAYVLALSGQPQRATMSRLTEVTAATKEPLGEARLHLSMAWLAAGRRDLAENLLPQSIPPPRQDRALGATLSSPVRDRAMLVSTLLEVQPDHPALPELVQQLAAAGKAGQWRSTQDVAFSLLALGHYLRQAKSTTPFETAELLLDGTSVATTSDGKPLVWQPPAPREPGRRLEVRITGPSDAKAYVAWLQTGIPVEPPRATDHGMQVRRRYLDEHGRQLDPERVRSGDLVQVELSLQSASSLENVVIEDLLPAGLEIENSRLQTSEVIVGKNDHAEPDNVLEANRLDVRDDRLVLMCRLRQGGAGRYIYTARTITAGTFLVPPVRAECMYDTALNSLWGSGVLRVEEGGGPAVAGARQ